MDDGRWTMGDGRQLGRDGHGTAGAGGGGMHAGVPFRWSLARLSGEWRAKAIRATAYAYACAPAHGDIRGRWRTRQVLYVWNCVARGCAYVRTLRMRAGRRNVHASGDQLLGK